MIKTLDYVLKMDRERWKIPRSVQHVIPVQAVWQDGIFQVGRQKFSKTFRFTDINYAVADRKDKEVMVANYGTCINALESGATTKITIHNRRITREDFEQKLLYPMKDDDLDELRKECNAVLLDKLTGTSSIMQEKYITVSVYKKNIEEARAAFQRIGTGLTAQFGHMSSRCTPVNAEERLRILHHFFHSGEESQFQFSLKESMRLGHSFKDYIAPDTFEFECDHFRMGERYGRVLFLRDYASYISDDMVSKLCELNKSMMLSIDMIPVPTDEAIRDINRRLLGVDTSITNWQRRQNQNNNFSAEPPANLKQQRTALDAFLKELTENDQRMTFCVLTIVHTADTLQELDNDTETLKSAVCTCQLAALKFQQMQGLNTVLPYGVREIDSLRTLTSNSAAAFMPFHVQEIYHDSGIYYGQNAISKNLIIADRNSLLNGNSFILGVSGSGKSFTGKLEIIMRYLMDDSTDVIIIDPERECSLMTERLGGQVIQISAKSPNHINAMDINADYADDGKPIALKSQFLMSLCEQLTGKSLGPKQKSIIDRCTANVYRDYMQRSYTGLPPTLKDLRELLLKQSEPEAKELGLELELYTKGSFNTFSQQTNVDTENALICYDILDLDSNLMSVGMLVVLDSILNRITRNRAQKRSTFIVIDEIYLMFQNQFSADFLFKLWKRVRKYGAFCTGITQNVGDLLESHTAQTMLSNSEFVIMLNQAAPDRAELAKLMNISSEQLNYITDVGVGKGLMKIGSSLIPFENDFPKDLAPNMYQLMTTKLNEV